VGGSGQGLGDFLSSLVDSAGTESADGIVFVVKGEAGCEVVFLMMFTKSRFGIATWREADSCCLRY
jgi:hypothetical protein